MNINKTRLQELFEVVSQYGKIGETGLCRPALSDIEKETFSVVSRWMKEAGMTVRIDNFGNLIGRLEGKNPEAPVLMIGSHLDSQPYGGRFDGTSGVLAGVEVAMTMADKGIVPDVPIEVIAFCDEESWRFKKGVFGSRGIVGKFEQGELDRIDKDGITRRQALIDFGCDPDNLEESVYPSGSIGAFLELHIEQGPSLDVQNKPVGIVTGIAGPLWFTVKLEGFAGHAGSVPMDLRKDALLGAAKMIGEINTIVRQEKGLPTVATIGSLRVFPDSPNIIPEKVEFTIDLRDVNLSRRNRFEQQIRTMIEEVATDYKLTAEIQEDTNLAPVDCAEWIQEIIAEESKTLNLDCPKMMSGPFHDAMVMANACDIGMIFVRCKDGISHNPAELASYEDLAIGTELLYKTALQVSSKIKNKSLSQVEHF
ncbi:M20 family metallo-hydrolase [Bacillus sp. CECT 9360]|uniref:M20 family metallo-hydrolase n=1 Tax=Bacillus sp. CECT 9360 TaxID=2845821 RepID=UPI001E60D01A|nr:M20 family metallo-hydrolase [Bacillus sp. CECT 9360]CAH0346265.1 N-carbamoyl-L-amino-acid hydrolase [Bacillus sp. CECT 9360]